ncbi:ribonuclease H-like domain, reverse transcriptase, RNA-dependent DNA polymerase [Tanacetum coccineum]
MEESLSKFMVESAKRHEEKSNLIKEIRAFIDAAIRNQGASIKALEIQIGKIRKVLQERGFGNLPSSIKMNPKLKDLDAYSIGTTLLNDALPTKEKDPVSFTLPCIINDLCFNKAIDDLEASVIVMPFSTYTKLGLGELAPTKLIVELAYKTVKHPKEIAKNVLVGIDKFVFPVDFIVLDIPEDIKTSLILGRPFLSTTHAKIDVFKRKITLRVGNNKVVFKSDKPTSNIIKRVHVLSLRERIELDLVVGLMGEALILNRSLDPLYGDYIKLNDLNEPLELRRNQVDDLEPTIEEGEVVDEPFMDMVKTRCDNEIVNGLDKYPNFVVVKNMDSYRDEGMGDIIVGRPFCKDAWIKERRFDGMITIYKGNDSVTYQMAQSHPRFKHLTNTQCNKMRPLLKVSAQDELKGISDPYQKLKGFYKEVLNLGPEYIKDEKVEEWLTRRHVSVHEME